MQKVRETLALILIGFLPFHAFFVTVGTRVILGPGDAPMGILALWKEALLGVVLLLAFVEWFANPKKNRKIDVLDGCIVALLFLSLIIHASYQLPITSYALGFRYDFIPLITFVVLRRVQWSEQFLPFAQRVLLGVSAVLAAYGLLTIVLPFAFFHWLGYSDLHSLYLPDKPLAAFQLIEHSALRRIQSAMSGPNHFGLWLLLPLGVLLAQGAQRRWRAWTVGLFVLLGVALIFTFSRAAFLGGFVMLCVALFSAVSEKRLALSRKVIVAAGVSIVVLLGVLASVYPSVILRFSSSRGHLEKPLEAVQLMAEHPFGLGLGAAGPASNRLSEPCVFLGSDGDPSWAEDRPELCVFLGDTQVQPPLPSGELRPAGQPAGRACDCPLLTENWYLQIGVELGWIGFILFLLLTLLILKKLRVSDCWFLICSEPETRNEESEIRLAIFLSFLALSIGSLFLHAWEDSAVAYSLWLLVAASLSRPRAESH